MNGSRKAHSKSRNGCGQCKKRRVRCDLRPPVCSNCLRRREACDYQANSGSSQLQMTRSLADHTNLVTTTFHPVRALDYLARISGQPTPASSAGSFAQVPSGLLSPQEAIIQLLEKIWLHPCVSPTEKSLWGQELEQQARQFRYLGPGAFSLFALYLSSEGGHQRSSEFRADAFELNIEASNLFCGSQVQVTEKNWLAVMAFGICVMVFHFGTARSSPREELNYLVLFHLLRHTCKLFYAIDPYFRKSQLKAIVTARQNVLKYTLDEETWQAVRRLDDIQHPDDASEGTRRACRQAVAALQGWVKDNDGHPRSWAHFVMWQGAVTDDFAALMNARYPAALLIFVYWCTVMSRIPSRWYLDGLWAHVASAVMMELGEAWDDLLDWPRGRARVQPEVVGSDENML